MARDRSFAAPSTAPIRSAASKPCCGTATRSYPYPRGLAAGEGLALRWDVTVAAGGEAWSDAELPGASASGETLWGLAAGEAGFSLHRFRIGLCPAP